ncbi:hypothetical protein [Arthrobacter sp. fls2-241-R2A-200]|uniref:hypothetical protein n=1 Tax=Arthrobacter sp. fls2-241-R2A-200 TaxID=3040281 RepID=UPI00254FB469|nr:hypothetical protein [Arthrobacter sp. fls2-241-R2A-200]
MGPSAVQEKWSWVAGPVAVALGLVAHLLSGGSAPSVPVLLALTALCALAAELVGRWIHGPILLLLISGLAQQLLFFGFDTLGGSFPGGGLLTHSHGPQQIPTDVTSGANSHPAAHAGDLMLYTHAAAAILTLLIGAGVAKLVRSKSRSHSGAVTIPGR